jgi:hypothetical protein
LFEFLNEKDEREKKARKSFRKELKTEIIMIGRDEICPVC